MSKLVINGLRSTGELTAELRFNRPCTDEELEAILIAIQVAVAQAQAELQHEHRTKTR